MIPSDSVGGVNVSEPDCSATTSQFKIKKVLDLGAMTLNCLAERLRLQFCASFQYFPQDLVYLSDFRDLQCCRYYASYLFHAEYDTGNFQKNPGGVLTC